MKVAKIINRVKEIGYSELKVYTCKYKFGELNLAGKMLQYYLTYDKKENIITSESFFYWGAIVDDPYRKRILKYNDKGLLIEGIGFDSSGEFSEKNIWDYNDKGLLIEERTYGGKFNIQDPRFVKTYKYGSNNLLLLTERYIYLGKNKTENRIVEKYNNKGLLIEETEYNYSDMIAKKFVIEYNNKDLPIKKIYYDSSGRSVDGEVYKYDDKGLLIESMAGGKFINNNKCVYTYNDKGSLIQEIRYNDKEKMVGRASNKYNKKNLLIEEIVYDSNDKLRWKTVRKYNDKDLVIEETEYNSLDEPVRVDIYEYK